MTTAVQLAQSVAPGVSLGFKNRIINGGMTIDQRNAGASVTTNVGNYYTLDRFFVQSAQASKFTVQQNAGAVTPPTGFKNYLGITSASSYSVQAGDYFSLIQIIEGYNIADLNWGTANASPVTISFWVRSSLTGSFGGSLRGASYTRNYPFSYTISAANIWEYKTITIPGCPDGTWVTNNGAGLVLLLGLGYGSTYGSGTAGAWTSATNAEVPSGSVSIVGTSGATFYITGVQLEVGTAATSFEFRDYGRELIMCQRYYETSFDIGTAPASGSITPYNTGCVAYTTSNARANNVVYKVTKRSSPTVVLYTPTNYGGLPAGNYPAYYLSGTWYVSTYNTIGGGNANFYMDIGSSTTISVGASYLAAAGWAASAEL